MTVFRQWLLRNFADFNSQITNEEELKVKALPLYLAELGYAADELSYNTPISVQIGTKQVTVYCDVVLTVNGKPQVVIDTKNPTESVTEKDILQSASYAKLIATPAALFGITTNGLDVVCTNVHTGRRTDLIPTRQQLIREVDRTVRRPLSQVELREVKSALITLLSTEELYKVIHDCKDTIEKKGLIRSDQSFREMTKIILVKMSEERRAQDGQPNRFLTEWILAFARANSISFADAFRHLFQEAKQTYPEVYTADDDNLKITDEECLQQVVAEIEDFSFLGTGDDIKGAVYEIFLKSTLRGELDQYFTPREIVEFMVQLADPEAGQVILDPACGSGGFLIQAFRYVNQKILNTSQSDADRLKAFDALIHKHLWGQEADYDLHVLAKINLIMHGDGWNNIYQGDALTSPALTTGFAQVVLTNPPFTIPYAFPTVLSRFEMGLGRQSQELDILFTEKGLDCLQEGGHLFIVLPEGMLNTRTYLQFREWLLSKAHLLATISLPEGAFVPFGKSVSKTCILGLRKKDPQDPNSNRPAHVLVGTCAVIGYEANKTSYRPTAENDLQFILQQSRAVFAGVATSPAGGECAWIPADEVTASRVDASYLLNLVDRDRIRALFPTIVNLRTLCRLRQNTVRPTAGTLYNCLEVPDITPETGTFTNLRVMDGKDIPPPKLPFKGGDVLFVRINPRISRVALVPDAITAGLVSTEVYALELIDNPLVKDPAVLCALLQHCQVNSQITRLVTGSSSSRARVPEAELLDEVYVPIPDQTEQEQIGNALRTAVNGYWTAAQNFGQALSLVRNLLGSPCDTESLRRL